MAKKASEKLSDDPGKAEKKTAHEVKPKKAGVEKSEAKPSPRRKTSTSRATAAKKSAATGSGQAEGSRGVIPKAGVGHATRVVELLVARNRPLPEHSIREELGLSKEELEEAIATLSDSSHVDVTRVIALGAGSGRGVCDRVRDDLRLHSPTTPKGTADRLSINEMNARQCLVGLVAAGDATRVGDVFSKA